MKKLLALAIIVAAGWFYFHQSPATWRGIPAAKDPVQSTNDLPAPFPAGRYTITPLARYKITAVTLSRERYRVDPGAELSPIDLALGWGPMSMSSTINELTFSQSGRWYEYQTKGEPPLEPAAMSSHSANTHCLPANAAVRQQLLAVKRHDLVTMEGYLVEVTGTDGYHWRSSLTREDTGGGSCEVFWITAMNRKQL